VIDFLFLRSRSNEKIVPCILAPTEFDDLIEVERPYTRMFHNPGITKVPLVLLPRILERVMERNLSVQLKRIDPNSLGRQHVLTIDVGANPIGEQKAGQSGAPAAVSRRTSCENPGE
jgi:hypothetical protein